MEYMKSSLLLVSVIVCLRGCSGTSLNLCTASLTETSNNQSNVVLLYNRVSAVDNSSCMHYVWSTKGYESSGYPTLFVAQTENYSNECTLNCSTFLDESSQSVNIPDAVESYFSLAIVFTRLIEFAVDYKSAPSIDGFNATCGCGCGVMSDLDCEDYSSLYFNDTNVSWDYDHMTKTFSSANYTDPESGNVTDTRVNITANFPTSTDDGRLPMFPKTLFTANSTTIGILIAKFPYNLSDVSVVSPISGSRIALETFLIHGPSTTNGSISSVQSLDDEYTPSVFTTMTYKTPDADNHNSTLNGFLQWKPISYQDGYRKSTSSQQVNIFYTAGYPACDTDVIPDGLASVLLSGKASNVTRWFAVIGTSGDETFFNNDYLTWTSVVGFGRVPEDQISKVVIITIIVGLGVPAVLVLLGAVYVFIKKKPWQNVHRLVAKATGSRRGYTKLN